MNESKETYLLGKGGIMNACRFLLPDKSICVGTDVNSCAIIYPFSTRGIDPVHCQVLLQNGRWFLVDFSEDGTWLNGQRMNHGQIYILKDGDKFFLSSPDNEFSFNVKIEGKVRGKIDLNSESYRINETDHIAQKILPEETIFDDGKIFVNPTQTTSEKDSAIISEDNETSTLKKDKFFSDEKEVNWKDKFFRVKGRIGRKSYLLRLLPIQIVGLICYVCFDVCSEYLFRDDGDLSSVGVVILIVSFIVVCICGASGWSLFFRRVHDIDLSRKGWALGILLWVITVGIVPNLYLLFKKGTNGPNRYGPDPLNLQS